MAVTLGADLPGAVVSGDWLRSHLGDVVVVDVRWYLDGRSGREAYRAGHVPGAVFADVDADLASPPSSEGGRHPLPSPERFAEVLGRLGIGPDVPVVAYDDAGGSTAARLWWLLHLLGQPAAVLDGGLAAWPGELQAGEVAVEPVERAPRPWPVERIVPIDDVERRRDEPGALLLDARAANRYAEGDSAIDRRPGHIPGAVSAPWAGNLDPTGRFLAPEDLRARYAGLGVGDGPVVAYCGSGVTACHDLLSLHLAGFDDTALFVGSWSAWAADDDRPIEVGAAAT
ncbi:MAG: sulfurtransferase [Acidimicrobiia bacterium]